MPQDVIDRVHTLARRSNAHRGLTFACGNGDEIGADDEDCNSDDDSTCVPPLHLRDNDDKDNACAGAADADSLADTHDNQDDGGSFAGVDPSDEENDNQLDNNGADSAAEQSDNDGQAEAPANNETDDTTNNDTGSNTGVEPVAGDPLGHVAPKQMDHMCRERTRENLRPRRSRRHTTHKCGSMSREHIATQVAQEPNSPLSETPECHQPPSDHSSEDEQLEHVAMTQCSAKQGLKVFGEEGAQAILKEMKQLNIRDAMEPIDPANLTQEQKKMALEHLMFLKKKRCGRIKGRGCADRRKQRICKSKGETSAPTVSTEALFLSCMIDALERRDAATVDIPGAFVHAEMDELTHVRLSGPLATLMARVDPKKHDKCVRHEGGKPVLCARSSKALRGTLQAALLFWKDLSGLLQEWGFTINKCDSCVANLGTEGSQRAILWHVDDSKISHVNHTAVTGIVKKLNDRHGKEAPLTKTRGPMHDCLGMTIDCSVTGKVSFGMDDCVQETLAEARDDKHMTGDAVDPAADHLFAVNNDNPDKLDETDADCFHTTVAKLLLLSKRARPDIQQAVAFLTT